MRVFNTAFSLVFFLFGFLAKLEAQTEGQQTYDIPFFKHIEIDGNPVEWRLAGMEVNILSTEEGLMNPLNDFDIKFKTGWNEEGLLILAEIIDDKNIESEADILFKDKDNIQIFIVDYTGDRNFYHVTITPGHNHESKKCSYKFSDHRGPIYRSQYLSLQAFSSHIDGKQYVEVLLPWSNLSLNAENGKEFGIQLSARDYDSANDSKLLLWYPSSRSDYYAEFMHKIRLTEEDADNSSIKVDRVIAKDYCLIRINATIEHSGQIVTIFSNGKKISEGKLERRNGRCFYEIFLNSENYDNTWPSLAVNAGKTKVASFKPALIIERILDSHLQYIGYSKSRCKIQSIKYSGNFVNDLSWKTPKLESFPAEVYCDSNNVWKYKIQESDGLKTESCIKNHCSILKNGQSVNIKTQELSDIFWILNPFIFNHIDTYYENLRFGGVVKEREGKFILIKAIGENREELKLYFDLESKVLRGVNHLRILEYKNIDGYNLSSVLSYNRKGGSSNYYWDSIEVK